MLLLIVTSHLKRSQHLEFQLISTEVMNFVTPGWWAVSFDGYPNEHSLFLKNRYSQELEFGGKKGVPIYFDLVSGLNN